ncbi:MAG TPA: AAA family ATPase [Halobacteriales archaeon]|nr:AAA family ATPase [Halobacteriales archaeon]
MKFNRLQLQNFKPYKEVKVNFKEGVTIIYGPNGSGKSTLLEACFFALYGKVSSRGRLEEIITKGEKKAQISLIFSQGEQVFHVEREITMRGDAAVTTKCTLKTPKDVISGSGPVGKEIEKILSMSSEDFVSCAYVRQGDINKLIEATPTERQALIDGLLQLGLLKKYGDRVSISRRAVAEIASEQRGAIEELNNQLNQRSREDLSREIKELEGEGNKIDKEISQLQKDQERKQNEVKTLKEIIESHGEAQREMGDLRISIEKLSEDLIELRISASKIGEGISKGRQEIQEKTEEKRELQEKIDRLLEKGGEETPYELSQMDSISDKITNLKIEIKTNQNAIEKMEKLIEEGKCPECGKEIEGAPRISSLQEDKKILSEKNRLLEEMGKKWKVGNDLTEKLKLYENTGGKIKLVHVQLNTLDTTEKVVKNGIRDKQDLLTKNQTKLKNLEENSSEKADLKDIENKKKLADMGLKNIEDELEISKKKKEEIGVEKIQKELEKKELKKLNERLKMLEGDKKNIESVMDESEKLKKFYEELRVELRQRNLNRLEVLLNNTFQIIYQNDAYSQIELDESYDLLVYQKDGESLNPRQLSGGERALFNLSLRSAIYRLLIEGTQGIAPMPPLILDEPTVFLDGGHVSKLGELISSMQEIGVEQILIVSHDDELLGSGGSIITVEKEPTSNRSEVTTH